MPKFSERIGIVESTKSIQVDSMSDELRNSLWNSFHSLYEHRDSKYWKKVGSHIAQFFLKVPVDELPFDDYKCRNWVKHHFYNLEWYEIYDITEFIVNNHVIMTREYSSYSRPYRDHKVSKIDLIKRINFILERELSGYRFISGVLTPISDKAEVDQIEEAIQVAHRENLPGAHQHIRTALGLLGKKPEPDYRNAIKESISAVESVVKQISGAQSKGLDDALSELSKKAEIHGALKSGFKKLYAYSSDEDGIRHAILDLPNVGFSEAKYMVVSCSAFVNYLISKAVEAGIL